MHKRGDVVESTSVLGKRTGRAARAGRREWRVYRVFGRGLVGKITLHVAQGKGRRTYSVIVGDATTSE